MHDHDIVAAIMGGDPEGLAAAYDKYAPGLYGYCRSMLTEPADAGDAVQDTFIVASSKLSGLREPGRLRAWLFAVARNECHRRLRARARASSAPLDEAAEATDDTVDLTAEAQQAEVRALVRAALSGLNPGEREIIELNLRHELDGADLADILGVSRNQAHALASRARSQFETSLGVLLVARAGREYCPDLAAILDGWDGELTVLIRKRVNRHIERCAVCGERKRRELNPAMLLGLLPVAVASASLKEQVLHLVADATQGSLAYRSRVVGRAEPFASSGFPPQVSPPQASPSPLRPAQLRPAQLSRVPRLGTVGRGAVATGAAAAVLVGGLLFVRHQAGPPAAAGPAPGSTGAAPHASASGPGSRSGRSPGRPGATSQPGSRLDGTSAHSARTSGTGPGSGSGPGRPGLAPTLAVPASGAGATGTPAPVLSASASVSASASAAVVGTLSVSPTLVQVGLTITLTAEGGPVSYSITTPAVVAVSSSSGSLNAGESVSIRVSVALGGTLTTNATLTVSPGPTTVIVVPLSLAPLPLAPLSVAPLSVGTAQ
jgi:RNA polymerase sigma factor (sigma-70 family)